CPPRRGRADAVGRARRASLVHAGRGARAAAVRGTEAGGAARCGCTVGPGPTASNCPLLCARRYDAQAMNSWVNFSILWMLTGSPVAAALILLGAYAIADWYTFGFLRGVAQAIGAFRRGRRLRRVLLHNPHDRKARADLGAI